MSKKVVKRLSRTMEALDANVDGAGCEAGSSVIGWRVGAGEGASQQESEVVVTPAEVMLDVRGCRNCAKPGFGRMDVMRLFAQLLRELGWYVEQLVKDEACAVPKPRRRPRKVGDAMEAGNAVQDDVEAILRRFGGLL